MKKEIILKLFLQKIYAWPIIGLLYFMCVHFYIDFLLIKQLFEPVEIPDINYWNMLACFITPAMPLTVVWLCFVKRLRKHILDGKIIFFHGNLSEKLKWFDTPDELLPGAMYEPLVVKIFNIFGFYPCSWYWLAIRNVMHGLPWSEAIPVSDFYHKLPESEKAANNLFQEFIPLFGVLFIQYGWSVVPDPFDVKSNTGFVAVPFLTVRTQKTKLEPTMEYE